jgi:hypothetical protein
MGRIDRRVLVAARLAGAALVALGAVDIVIRGHSLSRKEAGAILLCAGAALLLLHVVLARQDDARASDAQLAAALSVPLIPVGVALLTFSTPIGPFGGDILEPFRDAASEGLVVAGVLYAIAYLLTRHPRWVLVVALALGFAAELQSAAPVPVFGSGGDSWTPALILSGAAAVAAVAAFFWMTARAEQQNLLVAAAVMLAAASETRVFSSGGGADAVRDLFLLAVLAAEVAIAWWRTTPVVAVAVVASGGLVAASLAERSGLIGVALLLAGVVLAAGATLWPRRTAGGGPAAEPPATAA